MFYNFQPFERSDFVLNCNESLQLKKVLCFGRYFFYFITLCLFFFSYKISIMPDKFHSEIIFLFLKKVNHTETKGLAILTIRKLNQSSLEIEMKYT